MMSYLVRRENFADGTPPPKKPYSAVQFKNKADVLLQGVYGTEKSSNAFLVDLMQKELDKAVTEGVVTMQEGLEFIKSRKKYYDDYLKEKSKTTDDPIGLPKIEERTELQGGTDPKTGMGFQKGNKLGRDLKDKPSLNVEGKNQYTVKTSEEIQAIIDANPDRKTAKNFYAPKEGKEKLLTFTDTKNPNVKFQNVGLKADPEKRKTSEAKAADKRSKKTKDISSTSLEKKMSAPIDSKLNLTHAGGKTTPVGLHNLVYAEGSANRRMVKPFEDKIWAEMDKFNKIYTDPKTPPEFKRKAATEYLKNDRALRKKYPEYAKLKTRLSFKKTSLTPEGFMVKEKLPDPKIAISNEPGMTLKGKKASSEIGKEILKKSLENLKKIEGVTTADQVGIPEASKTRNMFKNAFKVGKMISKPIIRAVSPFIPVVGTAGTLMGVADVAEAAKRDLRNEELGIAYLAGPDVAENYSKFKESVRGKSDEFEEFVP